jgi:hypothetical protein
VPGFTTLLRTLPSDTTNSSISLVALFLSLFSLSFFFNNSQGLKSCL